MLRQHAQVGLRLALVALGLCLSSVAVAQSMDESLRLYKRGKYAESAFGFYDVLLHEASADARDQAQIYLAESLRKQKLYVPALFYYSDLFKSGSDNRFYINAVEGLLAIQEALHDSVFVPSLISERLDVDALARLSPERIAQVNYLVGSLAFRQRRDGEARAFLDYVAPDSSLHVKAVYLLGLLDVRQGNLEDALARFERLAEQTRGIRGEAARVRRQALLAAGRTAYGMQRYDEAVKYFAAIPRFSDAWFEAMYEGAWAHFQKGDYGASLGELHSITSPYFNKRHIPEASVIQGTAYFANCQWDRVRNVVSSFKTNYEPMLEQFAGYLEVERESAAYYRDVVGTSEATTKAGTPADTAQGSAALGLELARKVRGSKRFRDFHHMLTHMAWEQNRVKETALWRGSRLAEDIGLILSEHRQELENAVGSWTQSRLRHLHAQLQNFTNQIRVLDFEVADAERQWLEQGKEILKGRRARVPRPDIPNDQWQHWNFDSEYWKGELGYYHYAMRSECE